MRKLSENLEETFRSDLTDFFSEYTETSIDSLITNPAISSLPIIAGIKLIKSIPNYLVARKILRFLSGLKGTNLDERVKFLEKINRDNKSIGNFNLLLLNVLNKLDQEEKAEIIAFIYKQMLYENLTVDYGIRIIRVIEIFYYSDLMTIHNRDISQLLGDQLFIDTAISYGIFTALDPADTGGGMILYGQEPPANKPTPSAYKFNDLGIALIKTMKEYHSYSNTEDSK